MVFPTVYAQAHVGCSQVTLSLDDKIGEVSDWDLVENWLFRIPYVLSFKQEHYIKGVYQLQMSWSRLAWLACCVPQ